MKTWIIKIKDRAVHVRALKKNAEAFGGAIRDLGHIHSYKRELTNHGGEESSFVTMCLFGPSGVAPKEGYQDAIDKFHAKIPNVVESGEAELLTREAKKILGDYMGEEDNRKTPEEEAARIAESNRVHEEHEKKRTEEREAYLAKYGNGEKVKVPEEEE